MNKTGNKQHATYNRSKFLFFSFFLFIAYNLSLVTLSGCGAKHTVLSDVHLSSVKFNQKAESAFKKGDYENALRLYNEALKINRSIENIDGIAINIINMTATYRKLSDKGNAHKQLDEILNTSPTTYSPLHLSEAAFLKAMLYFDEKNYDKTLEWTDKALSFCQSLQCSNIGKIYNLKGRTYLKKVDILSALFYTNKGLEINKSIENKQEEANSLRILAEAKLMNNEYDEAKKFYENALSIDKTLGLSKKITQDLMGIGNIFLRQGNCELATVYFKRALSVSENKGDNEGIVKVKEMIEKCLQNPKH